jgi:DNA repair photolyase
MVEINPDGVSVKGCSYIYPPRGQAGEYSALAANPYRGCGHKCAYCYVPRVTKQDRGEFNAGAVDRANYLDQLRKDAKKYLAAGLDGQVMISFTSDPYHPGDSTLTRQSFECLIEHGLGICALTKGGTRSFRDLDLFRPDRDAFASTLTSLDDRFSQKWESGAALPGDRIAALKAFHGKGIFTWVSLEPTIDVEASLSIVDATHEFVDLFKVGRVNYLPITKTEDWRDYTLRMVDKLQALGKAHYIKKDLQPFLPAGYHNPLRVAQHH